MEIREFGATSECIAAGSQITLLPPGACKSFPLVQNRQIVLDEWIAGAGACTANAPS